ncbi:unnamed protein product [Moneuplotes crassus]|uniref:Uncharacterized protein n=1 Tax=Euplotes crassus TaxID=5936 RepID=A0AAD1Y7Q9_EUPCR|nr:unnamed protein product [Moneuplotes crassus]
MSQRFTQEKLVQMEDTFDRFYYDLIFNSLYGAGFGLVFPFIIFTSRSLFLKKFFTCRRSMKIFGVGAAGWTCYDRLL